MTLYTSKVIAQWLSCTERQKPTLAAQILERRKHSANL